MTYRFSGSSGNVVLSLLFLFFGVSSFAGAQAHLQRNLPVSALQINQLLPAQPVEGTLNVIAVMVEFQPDSNRFTSGNGTFEPGSIPYLENPGTNIDALPHDQKYFEAHLEFAKNYFEQMSHNRLSIEYQVLPEIYHLDQPMEYYSPIGHDPDLSPLGELANDVWNLVAADGRLPLELNPHQNTAFIIFHAGVGRDVELTGTTLDKTPQDIPSVYLNRDALRRFLDDSSFSGFPIDNGNFLVNNTLILPRTLTRAGQDAAGNRFVLPLSTNGLVTAQIASHLGLPDLFNTQTGESGIGRFGLMDGAGIFSYNGLFPPEMSAWEKIYLGWEEPFDISPEPESQISLDAAVKKSPKSIARVAISNDEYFLIENRHRDPDNTGVTLTIQQPDGSIINQTFTNRDTSFVLQLSNFDDQLEPGVVINASNYDFSLPGGPVSAIDETDEGRILNGGFLIWHIDESVIRSQLAMGNGVNDQPDRRGVELMEADGAQDIGRPTQIGLTRNEANGSAFDFWWSGNDASVITPTGTITLYENRFGPDTTPDNSSKSGSPSFFELYDFSGNLPTATFSIRTAEPFSDLYKLTDLKQNLPFNYFTPFDTSYWQDFPLAIIPFEMEERSMALIPAQNGIHIYSADENALYDFHDSFTDRLQQPFFEPVSNRFSVAHIPEESETTDVEIIEWNGSDFSAVWNFTAPENSAFISSPSPGILQFDGTRAKADISNLEVDSDFFEESRQFTEMRHGHQGSINNNGYIRFSISGTEYRQQIPSSGPPFEHPFYLGLIESQNNHFQSFVYKRDELFLFDPLNQPEQLNRVYESPDFGWPALADFSRDGNIDFIFIDHHLNQIIAVNLNGAILNHFPISPPDGVQFTGTPLIADFNGDGNFELLVMGHDSYSLNIYAYNYRGQLHHGFPLFIGSTEPAAGQPVHAAVSGNFLITVSHTGDLKVWEFPNMENVLWGSKYGNQGNNKITGLLSDTDTIQPSFELLNEQETYNWPNPATDHTIIRFQTADPAEIQIQVTTTSGRLIYSRTLESRGGAPEEIEIDTSDWGSGGYMALISATANGSTERKLVKIAIAR